jgi:hypothetical protein
VNRPRDNSYEPPYYAELRKFAKNKYREPSIDIRQALANFFAVGREEFDKYDDITKLPVPPQYPFNSEMYHAYVSRRDGLATLDYSRSLAAAKTDYQYVKLDYFREMQKLSLSTFVEMEKIYENGWRQRRNESSSMTQEFDKDLADSQFDLTVDLETAQKTYAIELANAKADSYATWHSVTQSRWSQYQLTIANNERQFEIARATAYMATQITIAGEYRDRAYEIADYDWDRRNAQSDLIYDVETSAAERQRTLFEPYVDVTDSRNRQQIARAYSNHLFLLDDVSSRQDAHFSSVLGNISIYGFSLLQRQELQDRYHGLFDLIVANRNQYKEIARDAREAKFEQHNGLIEMRRKLAMQTLRANERSTYRFLKLDLEYEKQVAQRESQFNTFSANTERQFVTTESGLQKNLNVQNALAKKLFLKDQADAFVAHPGPCCSLPTHKANGLGSLPSQKLTISLLSRNKLDCMHTTIKKRHWSLSTDWQSRIDLSPTHSPRSIVARTTSRVTTRCKPSIKVIARTSTLIDGLIPTKGLTIDQFLRVPWDPVSTFKRHRPRGMP